MVYLKKVFSIFIVITILLTSVSQGLFVFARDTNEYNDIKIFAEKLTQMIRENDVDFDTDIENVLISPMYNSAIASDCSEADSSIYDDMPNDAFETCRLIVKSKYMIDYQNAIDCVSGYNDLYILQYDSEISAKKAYEYYRQCDSVEYVEPDIIFEATVDDVPGIEIPDDEASVFDDATAAAIEWLSDKIGFSDIKEKVAEKIEDDYVLVAVIDSGVDTDHELLADRLVESDINFSSSGERNCVEDDYGHGTHVAGIVANHTLNNVKIKPYKVLNYEGQGSLGAIAVAIDVAVADGADIINLSLTAKGKSQVMTDAINNAVANDVNVVVAAGNNGKDLDNSYYSPACIESAITVSATDRNDNLADFSNYDGTIDIAAPGTNIKSSYLNNTYLSLNGTSMAAPQVSAGLALLQSVSLDMPATECESIIKEYAVAMHENEGENHFGAGLLFLKYLLDGKPTVADPVFSVDSCSFTESFMVEITCPDKDAEIYYHIYDTDLGSTNLFDGLKYSEPIKITVDTKISAIAYAKGQNQSSIVTVEYDRIGNSEEDFYDINMLGYITAYYGSEKDVIVPDVIKDTVVKGIGIGAFKDNRHIQTIVLPDSCEKINASAFKDCSSLVSISGTGITEVSTSVFENSSVETVVFPNLQTIGTYAFSGCSSLSSITLSKVNEIGSYAFQNTTNLGSVYCNKLTEMGMYVFSQSGITSFSAPKLSSIGNNAFIDSYNLVSVSAPELAVLQLGAFKNCISLKTIDMPSLTEIGANAVRNTGIEDFSGTGVKKIGNYALADNYYLKKAYFPAATSTGTNVFLNCSSLQIVGLLSLEELNGNTFSNCPSLINLYLPNAVSVVKSAFKGSSVEFLRFEKIETINDLPTTLKALILPNTVSSVTASAPNTDYVVYGYDDSYAEQYASNVNKRFEPIPAIYYKTSQQVSVDETYIFVYAIGFNCKYQWYRNDVVSNVGGTVIEDAVQFFYEPSPEDDCAAYYCEVTCDNGSYHRTITTEPILNAPEYRTADYTEYNKLVEEIKSLDRDLYNEEYLEEVDELLKTDISGLKLSQQDIVDGLVGRLNVALELVKNSFVMGDLNGDNRVSGIDVRFALKNVAGLQDFTKHQLLAADMDNDGVITAVDARLIMQKSLEI